MNWRYLYRKEKCTISRPNWMRKWTDLFVLPPPPAYWQNFYDPQVLVQYFYIVTWYITTQLTKKRLEKSRGEFFFRTQRIANRLHHSIDFGDQHGLKHRVLKQMGNDIMLRYKPENVCTWQICCDCQHCRETWSNFYNCFDREKSIL